MTSPGRREVPPDVHQFAMRQVAQLRIGFEDGTLTREAFEAGRRRIMERHGLNPDAVAYSFAGP